MYYVDNYLNNEEVKCPVCNVMSRKLQFNDLPCETQLILVKSTKWIETQEDIVDFIEYIECVYYCKSCDKAIVKYIN